MDNTKEEIQMQINMLRIVRESVFGILSTSTTEITKEQLEVKAEIQLMIYELYIELNQL